VANYPCPSEVYCAKCPFYQAEGLCLHALIKEHREQENYHMRLRQKYEAEVRRITQVNILKDAVKPEAEK